MTCVASDEVRLIIVDDDPFVRGPLSHLLDQQEGIHVVTAAENGYRAIEAAAAHRPNLALIDIDMPGIDGIETAVELRKRHPSIVLVMYTAFHDDSDLAEVMGKVDIAGFLTKDMLVPELATKLREAAAGKKVFSERPIELMTGNYLIVAQDREQYRDFREAVANLPPSYMKVFYPLAQAKSYRQIAQETGLSEATVRTYASRIFEAVGIESKAELTLAAVRAGIEFPPSARKTNQNKAIGKLFRRS